MEPTFYAGTSQLSALYKGSELIWNGEPAPPPPPRVAAVGNSTIAVFPFDQGILAVPNWIAGIMPTLLAVPGNTIGSQRIIWNDQSAPQRASYDVVIAQIGLNNIIDFTTPQIITELQAFMDDIRSSLHADAKLIVSKMLPCKQRWYEQIGENGLYAQQRWVAVNEAIAGLGPTPITGVDGLITSHVPRLDDGNGNLAPQFIKNPGDNICENNAGRQIIANAWRATLVNVGALSA